MLQYCCSLDVCSLNGCSLDDGILTKQSHFTNFRQVKVIFRHSAFRHFAILGLIKNAKCTEKLARYVLLLYTYFYKLIQQKNLK